ncbi:MAG: hypothetical protein WCJ62_10600 [Flavobacterium sp.]
MEHSKILQPQPTNRITVFFTGKITPLMFHPLLILFYPMSLLPM